MKALSVRQPWAWLIVEGFKPIENRSWPPPRDMVGKWIMIHAAKACTEREYAEACTFAIKAGQVANIPPLDRLRRGGVIGCVKLARIVRSSPSKWFVGKWGWVLTDPLPLPFRRCPGQLGFFDPQYLESSSYIGGSVPGAEMESPGL